MVNVLNCGAEFSIPFGQNELINVLEQQLGEKVGLQDKSEVEINATVLICYCCTFKCLELLIG